MKFYNAHDYINHYAKSVKEKMAYDTASDLESWQKEAREKLVDLLGLPFEMCENDFSITEKTETEDYIRIDFEYQSEEGFYVPCNLLIPKGEIKPRPVAICLQGHSTGKHISIGVAKYPNDNNSIAGGRDFAVRAVKEGLCAIAMDQRYMGETGHGENGTPSCITDHENMPSVLLGRTAIGERVWDIMRLIDVIYENLTEYIDKDKIICMGNSGGGTATFYASCVDERINYSMPSCAVCTYEASIMAMNHCSCNFIPGIRKYFNMGDLGCLIAPRPFVLVCGKDDPIFPLAGVKESFDIIKKGYKDAGKEDLCHMVIGQGGHQFYPDDAWPVMHKLLEK